MLAICQLPASCCYHAQFQEVYHQKHTNVSKNYDNNLVKESSWKEISGELHAQDKGTFTKDTALSENGRVVAGERHCMCESTLKIPDFVKSAFEGGRLPALLTGRLYSHEYPVLIFKRLS
jgi:hypothetical protein